MLPRRLLALVRSPGEGTRGQGGRLASVTVAADGLNAFDLLGRAPGQPRTFWEHEGVWSAGVGAAVTLEVRHGGTNGNGAAHPAGTTVLPAVSDQDRFEAVKEAAAQLCERAVAVADDGGVTRPPRFYGGFSFHEDHRSEGPWEGFPSARFVVPSLELEGGPHGVRLTATVAVPANATKREAIAAARAELARAQAGLDAQGPARRTDHPSYERAEKLPLDVWDEGVEQALGEIRAGALDKVVLARTLGYRLPVPPDPVVVLHNLRGDNPGTSVFLFEPRPGSAFLGAAPERIGAVRGNVFHANAVAGSMPRGQTPEEDDALGERLLASAKDRAEHAFVVDSMRRRLTDLADHVEMGGEPHLLRLTRIQHLETDLYARLADGAHVLDTVRALHPTPAVCGSPRDAAMAFLRAAEPFERGWYAGPVGWFDARGDGAFAPGLRAAVLQEDTWHLYAGAGIVEGSVSALEWDETSIKFEPVLRALGIGEEV